MWSGNSESECGDSLNDRLWDSECDEADGPLNGNSVSGDSGYDD